MFFKGRDEYFESTELNALDNSEKENRKYGLFLCLSTQMPGDVPVETLRPIGIFISDRLINYQDREAIANACSTDNKETLSFLPSLGAGASIITGVDFPMPISVKVDLPIITPPDLIQLNSVEKFPLRVGAIRNYMLVVCLEVWPLDIFFSL